MAITTDDIIALVTKWPTEMLERRNADAPGSSGCLATYPDGSHCLVAQICADFGLILPPVNSASNECAFSANHWPQAYNAFTKDAQRVLFDLQIYADQTQYQNFEPLGRRTWGEALMAQGLL